MKKALLIIFSLSLSIAVFPGDFVNKFIETYEESERPLSYVNIGKTMLERMAENTGDEELKAAFQELNSIRIVNSDNAEDSRYYFEKANELVKESFLDYEEVVSVNESMSKWSVFMKKENEDLQNLILITIDTNGKFSLITVSGKIDFSSLSKLSGTLNDGTGATPGIR